MERQKFSSWIDEKLLVTCRGDKIIAITTYFVDLITLLLVIKIKNCIHYYKYGAENHQSNRLIKICCLGNDVSLLQDCGRTMKFILCRNNFVYSEVRMSPFKFVNCVQRAGLPESSGSFSSSSSADSCGF